jgi:hypothetical protein
LEFSKEVPTFAERKSKAIARMLRKEKQTKKFSLRIW